MEAPGHIYALHMEERSIEFSGLLVSNPELPVAIGFLAALVVRDETPPVCRVSDLIPDGAVSQFSFKRQ